MLQCVGMEQLKVVEQSFKSGEMEPMFPGGVITEGWQLQGRGGTLRAGMSTWELGHCNPPSVLLCSAPRCWCFTGLV